MEGQGGGSGPERAHDLREEEPLGTTPWAAGGICWGQESGPRPRS